MNGTAQDLEWAKKLLDKVDQKLKVVAPRTAGKIPYTQVDHRFNDYKETDITWWTNGFYPATLYTMYAYTKDDFYLAYAREGEALLDGAFQQYYGLCHDVGFMWHMTSSVNYMLTGAEESKLRSLYAANILAARYNLKGAFIRAWNGEDSLGWTIIDCMMNLPLLYWASDVTKDKRYAMIAESHADTTLKHHVREDGSVRHIVVHDPIKGGYVDDFGGQGYEKGSSWSRGQAWAIYGFVQSYEALGKPQYLETAIKIADYFMENMESNLLPRCDFRAPKTPAVYDSTAAAIVASGLIDLARAMGEEGKKYWDAAVSLLKTMEATCCDFTTEEDAIVFMGTEAYHNEKTRHIPIIYGDTYFVEALYKLLGNKRLY